MLAHGTKDQLVDMVSDVTTVQVFFANNVMPDINTINGNCGVSHIEAVDHSLKLSGKNSSIDINGILARLIETGYQIRNIDTCKPNLETVFLNLTGRKLRDGEEG